MNAQIQNNINRTLDNKWWEFTSKNENINLVYRLKVSPVSRNYSKYYYWIWLSQVWSQNSVMEIIESKQWTWYQPFSVRFDLKIVFWKWWNQNNGKISTIFSQVWSQNSVMEIIESKQWTWYQPFSVRFDLKIVFWKWWNQNNGKISTIFSQVWSQNSVMEIVESKQWNWYQPFSVRFDLTIEFSGNDWIIAFQNSSLTKISQKILPVITVITQMEFWKSPIGHQKTTQFSFSYWFKLKSFN